MSFINHKAILGFYYSNRKLRALYLIHKSGEKVLENVTNHCEPP